MSCLDDSRSLFLLAADNPFRTGLIRVINSKFFFIFILVAIIVNSVALALNQPKYPTPQWALETLQWIEVSFIALFGLEMLIKILALGLVLHPEAYLRDPWNVFDACIVIVSIVAMTTNLSNLLALRTFRVLRPLRTVSHIKRLKALLNAIILSIPDVTTTFLFLLYFIVVVALFGLNMWSGRLSFRCFYPASSPHSDPGLRSVGGSNQGHWYNASAAHLILGAPSFVESPCGGLFSCPHGGVCHRNVSQFSEYPFTFDTIWTSMLLVFKTVILDDWPDDLNATVNATGYGGIAFFAVVTIFGGFFLVGVFLAILMGEYNTVAQRARLKQFREQERKLLKAAATAKREEEKASQPPADVGLKAGEFGVCDADELTQVLPFGEEPLGGSKCTGDRAGVSSVGPSLSRPPSRPEGDETASGEVDNFLSGAKVPASTVGDCSPRSLAPSSARVSRAPSLLSEQRRQEETDEGERGDTVEQRRAMIQAKKEAKSKEMEAARKAHVQRIVQERAATGDLDDQVEIIDEIKAITSDASSSSSVASLKCGSPARDTRRQHQPSGPPTSSRFGMFAGGSMMGATATALKLSQVLLPSGTGSSSSSSEADGPSLMQIKRHRLAVSRRVRTLGRRFDSDSSFSLSSSSSDEGGSDGGSSSSLSSASTETSTDVTKLQRRVMRNINARAVDVRPSRLRPAQPPNQISQGVGTTATAHKYAVKSSFGQQVVQETGSQQSATKAVEVEATVHRPSGDENRCAIDGEDKKVPAWRQSLRRFVHVFAIFMMVLTVANVAVLAADHHGIDDNVEAWFDHFSNICTIFFALELLLRLCAFGFMETFTDPFNVLDSFLIILSTLEYFFAFAGVGASFTALRALRAFRALRLAGRIPAIHVLLRAISPSMFPAFLVCVLLLIVVYIYAVVGMQLFGAAEFGTMRITYGTIWEAALANFIVVTSDGWGEIFAAGIEINSFAASLFFISLFAIGNFIVINLFAAVIVEQLDAVTSADWDRARRTQHHQRVGRPFPPRLILPPIIPSISYGSFRGSLAAKRASSPVIAPAWSLTGSPSAKKTLHVTIQSVRRQLSTFFTEAKNVMRSKAIIQGHAFGLLSPQNCFRRGAAAVVLAPAFRHVSVLFTGVNVVAIAAQTPRDGELANSIQEYAEYAFTGFYIIEMLLMMLAGGVVRPAFESTTFDDGTRVDGIPERGDVVLPAYFRSATNILNALIAVIAGIGLYWRPLRFLRSIRALKLVAYFPFLRITATALLRAIPHMLVSFLLSTVLWLVFAIFGVQVLKGQLYYCTDPSVADAASCTGHFNSSILLGDNQPGFTFQGFSEGVQPRQWLPHLVNFDHLGHAFTTLVTVALIEDWPEVMFIATDATGVGSAPSHFNRPYLVGYFVAFIIIGNFLTFSLILGVLVNYFIRYKKAADGSMLLSDNQRMYILAKRIVDATMFETDMPPPSNAFRKVFCAVVTTTISDVCNSSDSTAPDVAAKQPPSDPAKTTERSHKEGRRGPAPSAAARAIGAAKHLVMEEEPIFELFMAAVVIANAVFLAMYTVDLSDERKDLLDLMHLVFVCVFSLEVLMKLVAELPRAYFSSFFNRLDFIATLVMVVAFFTEAQLGRAGFVARIFRILRTFKHFMRGHSAQKQFAVIIQGLPSLLNLVALLAIVFFMFSVAGVDLFSDVRLQGALNDINNFRNVGGAFLILFEIMSTEDWHRYLQACLVEEPYCSRETGDCGTLAAYPYFVIFVLFTFVIMLQLCVAIVVEHFEDVADGAENAVVSGMALLRKLWRELGGSTSNALALDQFLLILLKLPRRLTHLETPVTPSSVFHLLVRLRVPVQPDLTIDFRTAVFALLRHHFAVEPLSLEAVSPTFAADLPDGLHFTAGHVVAARIIWQRWQEYKLACVEVESKAL